MKQKTSLKLTCLVIAVVLPLLALAGTLRNSVTLVWDYPTTTTIITLTNGTDIVTVTNSNEVDNFILYASSDPTINTTNWTPLMTIAGTNRSVTIIMDAQQKYFVVTASNYWGESDPSNVAWVPSAPRNDVKLKLQR